MRGPPYASDGADVLTQPESHQTAAAGAGSPVSTVTRAAVCTGTLAGTAHESCGAARSTPSAGEGAWSTSSWYGASGAGGGTVGYAMSGVMTGQAAAASCSSSASSTSASDRAAPPSRSSG